MVNSLLFRWEDSQALQHHCGFCERPLSHPGAKASCFGTHSEPCHRFHQAMFMRNRAHMCNYCSIIDEAHYKRHHDLVTQLRNIYENCGEAGWIIVPVESGGQGRGRSSDAHMADGELRGRSLTPEETITSKRERKDAKCLARAANRTKPVTQEEIRYMDSVLHVSEMAVKGEGVSPANLEEMQLIEENLRYNASVYDNHSSREAVKRFAKISEVDIDFGVEVDRVFDTFRVTELVKRNLKNRGLQGKELKIFETLVDAFRNAVIEDLVLVKKDTMEVRMRRAGYLRYTNKTAYSIVEDRYAEKDWKTGERIKTSASESSDLSSPSEELVSCHSTIPDPPTPLPTSIAGSDRRHLQHVHTRVSGDDGLGQKVIEPYHAPLLPLTPNATLKRPTILQLKLIENKENRVAAGKTIRGWSRRDPAPQIPFGQRVAVSEKDELPPSAPAIKSVAVKATSTPLEPAWCKKSHINSISRLTSKFDERHFPSLDLTAKGQQPTLIYPDALAVQPPASDVKTGFQSPERSIEPADDIDNWHPVVSQKKTKKAQREAKRKAGKVSKSPEETLSPTAEEGTGFRQAARDLCEVSSSSSSDDDGRHVMEEMSPQSLSASTIELIDDDKDAISVTAVEGQTTISDVSRASCTPIPRTTYGKHDHWARFVRAFTVDQLTVPLLQSFEGCSHGSSCQFESHSIPDCPFHEPRCSCVDPLLNQCYLVYPGKQPCTAGPYNRAQGQRLMSLYEQQNITKGRVMLLDDDLVSYLLDPNTSPTKPDLCGMPPRLLREHTEFMNGYDRGPLMRQEFEFERLFVKNVTTRHQITTKMLRDIQRQTDHLKGPVQLSCYCRTVISPKTSEITKEFGSGFVSCSYRTCEFGGVFHKGCVKKLGVEKVSRWYCSSCDKKMTVWAHKALNMPHDIDNIFWNFTDEEKLIAKKVVDEVMQPGGVMDRLKSCM